MGGACCSCFDKDTDESQDGTEMQVSEAIRKALVVAKSMSAPSIRTEGNKVCSVWQALLVGRTNHLIGERKWNGFSWCQY